MVLDRLFSAKKSIYFEFLVVFLIALLARGNGIFGLSWGCDDFLAIADPTGVGYAASQASQLRVVAALTTRLVGWLGAGFPPLGAFWNASNTASMVVFALALRRLWIPRSASIYGILIGLLFSSFPYHINLLAFQLQHPSMVMSYLTGAYGIANAHRSGWRRWVAVLAIAASLSYQTMISYFVAAGLVLLLIQLFRFATTPGLSLRDELKPFVDYALLIGMGTVAYVVLSLLALKLSGIPTSSRASFAQIESLPQKLQLVVNHLKRTAFGLEPSMPRSTKLLQSSLWLVAAAGLSLETLRQRSRRFLIGITLLLLLLSAATVASAFLPTILMDHTSENPRNLLATVVFAGGIVALVSLIKSRRFKILALALAGLLVLSYAMITNSLSVDLARLTSRDLLQASRMVERLDLLRGAKPLKTVVFVGSYAPNVDLRGREYYQSGFEVSWAQLPLLQEASGQPFRPPSDADRSRALALAVNRPAWPSPGSVAVDGDVGLVVLSQAQSNSGAIATPTP